jgi:hypothetical protein
MKHILNNLTEQEKNAIREQHTGGMEVMTENFSKLTNSKLGDSKPLVNEQGATGWKEEGEGGKLPVMTMEQFFSDPNWGGRSNVTGGDYWKVQSGFSGTEIIFGKGGKKIRVTL